MKSRLSNPREVHKEEHIEERLVFAVGNDDRDWKNVFFYQVTFSTTKEGPTYIYIYIVLLAPYSTTDIAPFVPEAVEYLCRVGVDFTPWNEHNPSHSREIRPAEISTAAGTPYGFLC